jgi:hypothetical protein
MTAADEMGVARHAHDEWRPSTKPDWPLEFAWRNRAAARTLLNQGLAARFPSPWLVREASLQVCPQYLLFGLSGVLNRTVAACAPS